MPTNRFMPQQIWGIFIAVTAFVFVLYGAAQASESSTPQEPDQFLQVFGDQAIGVLSDQDLDEVARIEALNVLLTNGFDMDRIAKLALGRYWRAASESDRSAYQSAFEQYIVGTYDRRLRAYAGQKLVVKGWQPTKRDALVTSDIVGSGVPISIDWRLRETPEGWRILDVVVEGVSMLITQRNEFASIIERKGGVGALVNHLRGAIQTADAS